MLLTVGNVGRILDLYTVEHPERGVTEVARELDMTKSKAHLLLSSMVEVGMLRRVAGGRYRLGWRVLTLDRIAAETTPFRLPGRAAAAALARRCGETVHLAALDGGRVIYVDRMQGERAVQIAVSQVGATLPAHCSGVGKLLLAHLDREHVEEILERHGLDRFTANTITSRRKLYEELEQIRRTGVSRDREEVMDGLGCVAAPIRDDNGEVVAALSVSTGIDRMDANEDAFRRLVVAAADGVTRRLQRH